LPTILPDVGEGGYDYSSLLSQALNGDSYRPFVSLGYLHFKLGDTYPVLPLKTFPETMSLSGGGGIKMSSVRRTLDPDSLGLDVLISTEELKVAIEMHELHALHTIPDTLYDVDSVLPSRRFGIGNQDDRLVTVRGFASVDELDWCHPVYKLPGKTSLQLMLESGEVVKSSTGVIGSPFDYTLDRDTHIERSGISGEAYPIVSLGAPGSIHPLERRPMDLAAVYINVSGGSRVFEVFSYDSTITLEEYLTADEEVMSSIRPGPPGCRSILHHGKLCIVLGEVARQFVRSTRVVLKPGEVLVTLPGSSVQAFDVDFNAVVTCCLASSYWISFHICLNQVRIQIYPSRLFPVMLIPFLY
jgi:hypothetical protein